MTTQSSQSGCLMQWFRGFRTRFCEVANEAEKKSQAEKLQFFQAKGVVGGWRRHDVRQAIDSRGATSYIPVNRIRTWL